MGILHVSLIHKVCKHDVMNTWEKSNSIQSIDPVLFTSEVT